MSDEKLHSWFKTEETYAGAAQLPPGSASLAGLAEALEVNPSTALRMVERLTTAGMVEKAANPARRREVLLRLTGSGWQTVRQVTEYRRTEFARIVAAMPAE